MDDSPVEEYRNKMLDWSLPLSQYSHQCQACFAPQSSSGLDIVENTEQGRHEYSVASEPLNPLQRAIYSER